MSALSRSILLVLAITACFSPAARAALSNAPEIIVAAHNVDGTTLVWTPVVGATSYTVYRGESPDDLRPIAHLSSVAFFDAGAPATTTYYAVAADVGHRGPVFMVGGEGCVAMSTTPTPSVATHLDSCVGPIQ